MNRNKMGFDWVKIGYLQIFQVIFCTSIYNRMIRLNNKINFENMQKKRGVKS